MRVLIVRHGEAVDDAGKLGDKARWLTPKGRRRTRVVADWLAGRPVAEPSANDEGEPGAAATSAAAAAAAVRAGEWKPAAVLTSQLVRAVQTAEIVALAANLDNVDVDAELAPEGSPKALAKRLRAYDGPSPLAIVGHEPGLSELARELLGEDVSLPLNKSGVIAIELAADKAERSTLAFHLRPKDMSVTTRGAFKDEG